LPTNICVEKCEAVVVGFDTFSKKVCEACRLIRIVMLRAYSIAIKSTDWQSDPISKSAWRDPSVPMQSRNMHQVNEFTFAYDPAAVICGSRASVRKMAAGQRKEMVRPSRKQTGALRRSCPRQWCSWCGSERLAVVIEDSPVGSGCDLQRKPRNRPDDCFAIALR
jgi:hypothetical protein